MKNCVAYKHCSNELTVRCVNPTVAAGAVTQIKISVKSGLLSAVNINVLSCWIR